MPENLVALSEKRRGSQNGVTDAKSQVGQVPRYRTSNCCTFQGLAFLRESWSHGGPRPALSPTNPLVLSSLPSYEFPTFRSCCLGVFPVPGQSFLIGMKLEHRSTEGGHQTWKQAGCKGQKRRRRAAAEPPHMVPQLPMNKGHVVVHCPTRPQSLYLPFITASLSSRLVCWV